MKTQKKCIIAFMETKYNGCFALLNLLQSWNHMTNIKYSGTLCNYLLNEATNGEKNDMHESLCSFSIYVQFCTEFAQRKRILIALCENVFENYGHVLAERVLSNIYIMERIYAFL